MDRYTLAIGTRDPMPLFADSEAEAIRHAVDAILGRYGEDLRGNPQEVATLMGPAGLITRPSERIDEFVARIGGGTASQTIQPGDTNAPDCNGD